MIRFLFKGLLRDKSRSRLPILVVAIGVTLSVFMHAYITGVMADMIEMSAKFTHGHLKIMTRAYAENSDQIPNDLAILDAGALLQKLKTDYAGVKWTPRIRFGGLVDVPDSTGETKSQGPAIGLGIDLLSPGTIEPQRLNLLKSLVKGELPGDHNEVLLSDDFARKLGINPGDHITLIGSTMDGSMAIYNMTVSGTIKFGTAALDRGTLIADISDMQNALGMTDATGEILGFKKAASLRKVNLGFIFQSYNLLGVHNVFENVEFPLLLLGIPTAERKKMVLEALEWVGLSDKVRSKPSQLSGGECQRVAIARAMVKKPSLVLADEPTANLDAANSHNVLQTMVTLNRELKTTFLFATHDEKVIGYLRRKIYLLDGRVDRDEIVKN